MSLWAFVFSIHAQKTNDADDGTWVHSSDYYEFKDPKDSLVRQEDLPVMQQKDYYWRPISSRAVWLGAILPGAGQIYNRSYWKLPILYGGFMGCAYAITFNNNTYQDYKTAYRDILTDPNFSPDDPSKSYIAILPDGYTVDRMGGKENYTNVLKNAQNSYRRYRDISIVATVLVYALSLIDAFVDAELYDFDISPDLSMKVEPQIHYDHLNNRSTDIHVAINF